MSGKSKILVVIAGPTAVGKTSFAIELAKKFNTEIISCDSRQFFREMSIGTAKPTSSELAQVKHHFIDNLSIQESYNVSKFEHEVLEKLEELFLKHEIVVMVGGSGLYIDAVVNGIDDFPDVDEKLRSSLKERIEKDGLESLLEELKTLDPEYYEKVDQNNPNRILRALEVCMMTGKKYSDQRLSPKRQRPFEVIKFAINRDRQELFDRISLRVDQMINEGLLGEVESLSDHRNLNALNTVGYKEIYAFFDGTFTKEEAIEKLKTNTRRYAKRQLTWLKRDDSYNWLHPNDLEMAEQRIKDQLDL